MSRLEKKCLISATTVHGLLLLVLFFGAALMPSREEPPAHLITVYLPDRVSDTADTTGGNPNVTAAPAPQGSPTGDPAVTTPPAPKPEPVKTAEPVKPAEPAPKPVETSKPEPVVKPAPAVVEVPRRHHAPSTHSKIPKPTKPDTSKEENEPQVTATSKPTKPKHTVTIDASDLKQTRRSSNEAETQREAAAAAERAEIAAANARRAALGREFASVAHSIGKNFSSGTVVEMPGPGGGGAVTANYRDLIASKYYNAWSPPTDLEDSTPTVTARITISRDGNVITARIIKSSGNRVMDRSIQNVLDTVTYIAPFPSGSSDQQRTVVVQFNLTAKRQIG